MDKSQILKELQMVMQRLFELSPESITLDAKLYEDLDLDSIDAVDLVVELQKMINKKINPDDFKSVRTVQNVVDVIEKLTD